MIRVLIVEDEPVIRSGIAMYLGNRSCEIREAETWTAAEQLFRSFRPEVAIVDYSMPDGNALETMPRLRDASPDTAILILTGHASIDLAVQAMKEGAENFLTKPIELNTLWIIVQRVAENRRSRRTHTLGRRRPLRDGRNPFLGTSRRILELADQVAAVVDTNRTLLIQGETGSGKGLLARWIHDQSPRGDEPYVDLNCSGLSRDLLESELFGFEKGAFTGASAAKQGLLEVADRGTMFLDEIGDIDVTVQPKLLKVIEDKTIRRLGDVRERRLDVRLIAATHRDLLAMQQAGDFRSDLYFRISTLPLILPPLRERCGDIPLIAEALLTRIAAELALPAVSVTERALTALRAYSWPGNIRELRNVLERAVLLTRKATLDAPDLLFDAGRSRQPSIGDPALTLSELETRHITAVLALENGCVDAAAKRLGISRSALYARLKPAEPPSSEIRTGKS